MLVALVSVIVIFADTKGVAQAIIGAVAIFSVLILVTAVLGSRQLQDRPLALSTVLGGLAALGNFAETPQHAALVGGLLLSALVGLVTTSVSFGLLVLLARVRPDG
jgi:hypothetical protein